MWYAINMKYSQQVLDQQTASRAQRQDRRWSETTSAALEAPKNLQNSEKDRQEPQRATLAELHMCRYSRGQVSQQSPFRVKAFSLCFLL